MNSIAPERVQIHNCPRRNITEPVGRASCESRGYWSICTLTKECVQSSPDGGYRYASVRRVVERVCEVEREPKPTRRLKIPHAQRCVIVSSYPLKIRKGHRERLA